MDARPSLLDDDHGATDAASIRRNLHGPVVVVDVDAHELTYPTSAPHFPEVRHEAGRILRQANDIAVHTDNEGVRSVDLAS